jgi:hypothetical protein
MPIQKDESIDAGVELVPATPARMEIPPNPTITFNFNGLLVFCFDEANSRCQIGVHTQTSAENRHELRIYITKMAPVPVKTIPIVLGHDNIRHATHLHLEVQNPRPGTEGIKVHKGIEKINRVTGEGDPHDIAWMPDLDNGEEFFAELLPTKPSVLTPCLCLNNGYFYTASLTELPVNKVVNNVTSEFGFVTEYIGANIYLHNPSQTILRLGENGPEIFRFGFEDGVSYQVTIANTASPTTQTHNHFGEYYSAFDLGGRPEIVLEDAEQITMDIETGSCTSPLMLGRRPKIV